jgi:hypothetical protein
MLLLENDPNHEFYIEERAFLYHDPKETSDEAPNEEPVTTSSSTDLKPLPPPRAPPSEADFPKDSLVVWKYIEDQRVLLADFTKVVDETNLAHADVDFLAFMFERDDITCISQGLLNPAKLQQHLWDCNVRTIHTTTAVYDILWWFFFTDAIFSDDFIFFSNSCP